MIDICVLTCNRARITRICIEEIWKRTTTPYRLTVYDNGSTDGTLEVLQELMHRKIIEGFSKSIINKGVHWGHNALLELVESDWFVSTDADIIPMSPQYGMLDWLERLQRTAMTFKDYAALACLPHVTIGDNSKGWERDGNVAERPWVGAHLRLMSTKAVRQVGGWDKVVRPSRNNEERWICGKLKDAGWKVGYVTDVPCIHLFGDPEQGEDPWGYPASMTPQDHGHREISPSVNTFQWDRMGVDWETCRKEE